MKKAVKKVVLRRDRCALDLSFSDTLHSSESLVSDVTDVVLDDAPPVHVRRKETDEEADGASCVHHDSTVWT